MTNGAQYQHKSVSGTPLPGRRRDSLPEDCRPVDWGAVFVPELTHHLSGRYLTGRSARYSRVAAARLLPTARYPSVVLF